jgi:UDP-glucose 4-epimerase
MRSVITGGFGYLGGRLARFLAIQAQHDIVLGSRRPAGPPPWLPEARVMPTPWDSPAGLEKICDGADAVLHLAGMNAPECAGDRVMAMEVNAIATARLVQAAVRQGVKRFIYLSTAHVYGRPLAGMITEETCPVSLHPYAFSHRAGEDTIRAAHEHGEIEGIVIRLSNAYGAPAHKDANCWMLLVNDLCRQAVTTQRMVLNSSGRQRRDFITLTDACRAIHHLLELPAGKLGDGLFNVGGAWAPTILEMTERIAVRIDAVTGHKPEISRQADQSAENHESLDYKITKLAGTGFNLGDEDDIDRELDGLIEFCLRSSG